MNDYFDDIDFDDFFKGAFDEDDVDLKLFLTEEVGLTEGSNREVDRCTEKHTLKKQKVNKKQQTNNQALSNGNDIRRSYATMFINTMNSLDTFLYHQFLVKYCTDDVIFSETFKTIGNYYANSSPPKLIQLQGYEAITQYWYNKMQLLPDVHSTLLSAKVLSRTDSPYSKVIGTVVTSATKLYEVPHEILMPAEWKKKSTISKRNTSSSESHSNTTTDATPTAVSQGFQEGHPMVFDEKVKEYLRTVPLLQSPLSFSLNISLELHLDSDQKIRRIEFVVTPRETVETSVVCN